MNKVVLRKETKFEPWYYYVSIFYNFIGRFAWSFTLTYDYIGNSQDFFKILFGSLELIRRFNWSNIRLEHAQTSNALHYRRNKFVPSLN